MYTHSLSSHLGSTFILPFKKIMASEKNMANSTKESWNAQNKPEASLMLELRELSKIPRRMGLWQSTTPNLKELPVTRSGTA